MSATVTSSSPFTYVKVDGAYGTWSPVSSSSSGVRVTLETWGFYSHTSIQAIACPYENPYSSCSEEAGARFTARETTPQVTWSEDTTIGPGQPIDITVSDPHGGGRLVAVWPYLNSTRHYELDRAGTTLFAPEESHNTAVRIQRCSTTTSFTCSDFSPPIEKKYDVRLDSYADVTGTYYQGTIAPISGASPTTSVTVRTPERGPAAYSLTWGLAKVGSAVEVPGGTVSGALAANGRIPVVVDLPDLPQGSYRFYATYTVSSTEFGTIPGRTKPSEPFLVDRTPTTGATSFTSSVGTIYPLVGAYGYPGRAKFTIGGRSAKADDSVEIRDGVGRFVARTNGLVWSGDGLAGRVPAGTYTATLTDKAGNPAPGIAPLKVVVSTATLHHETYTRTVTAAGSLDDQYVGRCSSLRRPAARGWKGSLGLYANTRCTSQKGGASDVSTVHAHRLPVAARYGAVQVSAYGGAAKAKPGSRVILSYLRTNRSWHDQRVLSGRLGTHHGKLIYTSTGRDYSPYVFSDRYLVWGMSTGYANRYDVKSFTITVKMRVVR